MSIAGWVWSGPSSGLAGSCVSPAPIAKPLKITSTPHGYPRKTLKTDEYRRQAQITELNALNAALAVIRFKQHFKLLDRLDEATSYIFDSAMLEIDTEGRTR